MDEDGLKMSKSLGNVVDPNIIIKGGKVRIKNLGSQEFSIENALIIRFFCSEFETRPGIWDRCT